MQNPESAIRNPQLAIFALLIVAVYLFGLTIPLVGPDEPRYAQVAREMWLAGDWITPTLGGFNWFEKPALLYWLQIAAYSLFGVSEFSARLGPALFGLGTVLSLNIFGRIVEKKYDLPAAANWITIIAASSIGLLTFSRGASFDIIITFPLTAAMVSFFAFDQGEDRRVFPLFLFYFFIGVALLAKGLIGGVFPLTSVALYFLIARKSPSKHFLFSLFWGAIVAIVVASAWYLPMYLRHGWEFIDQFFVQHHLQRFASNKYNHPQPFYFFLWVLPLMTVPWLPILAASLAADARKRSFSNAQLFAFSWLIVPLVFFSFSGSKLPGYILPSLPPTMILIGLYARHLAKRGRVWRVAIASTAIIMLAGVVVATLTVVPGFADADSTKGLFAAARQKGYENTKVVAMHHFSHNAEFYAAGRLRRDESGVQERLFGPGDLPPMLERLGEREILVLVPKEYVAQLLGFAQLRTEFIAENSETALVLAAAR